MTKPVPIGAYNPIPTYEELLAEIARLRDELASATQHMEMAEAAWLRETAGNSPVASTLSKDEIKAIEWASRKALAVRDGGAIAATLRGLLERITTPAASVAGCGGAGKPAPPAKSNDSTGHQEGRQNPIV